MNIEVWNGVSCAHLDTYIYIYGVKHAKGDTILPNASVRLTELIPLHELQYS